MYYVQKLYAKFVKKLNNVDLFKYLKKFQIHRPASGVLYNC